jgi:thiamine-monophosphate kinase
VREVCAELGATPHELTAGAGDDYELCFCAPAASREAVERAVDAAGRTGVTWIGEVAGGPPGACLLDARGEEVELGGFEHRW